MTPEGNGAGDDLIGLGYRFAQPERLRQALTHRSAGNRNNERLEFLGDGILNFVIASALFERFPSASEGDLSRLRARLVRRDTLAGVGQDLGLGPHLILGQGELRSGGHRRSSILADAVEAILGAIYLDGGFEACATVIRRWFGPRLDSLPPAEELKDAKTRLQEYLQARRLELPRYELVGTEGKDHQRTFHVLCRAAVPGRTVEEQASGGSRRKAEQAAAEAVLRALEGADG